MEAIRYYRVLNTQRTKYLCIVVEAENLMMEGNKKVKTCKKYKYLGITLNRKRIDDQEINNRNNRITKARKIIACLNPVG
jgi:uncharacterized NAD-dependent epimerase/dehydratase family protein